jgi:hypothetical protein
MLQMPPHLSDAEFRRAQDQYYLQSVRAAAQETYWAAAWRPEDAVVPVLRSALERRGIEPDAEALRQGAALISRGRKPQVMLEGRRRKRTPS